MKQFRQITLLVVIATLAFPIFLIPVLFQGCSSPPTKIERRLFTIETNYVPIYTSVTNISATETNVVTVTNVVEDVVYRPGPTAEAIKETGGAVGNLFGAGGLVSTALAGIFSAWAWVRSSKRQAMAINLAQTIETVRSFIRQLPSGETYDTALIQWMQAHQADAGVLQQVMTLLAREVSNPDARVAAEQIREAITALNPSSLPPKK